MCKTGAEYSTLNFKKVPVKGRGNNSSLNCFYVCFILYLTQKVLIKFQLIVSGYDPNKIMLFFNPLLALITPNVYYFRTIKLFVVALSHFTETRVE